MLSVKYSMLRDESQGKIEFADFLNLLTVRQENIGFIALTTSPIVC